MATATVRSKPYLKEAEAARQLGVTVDELRRLVRHHISDHDEDVYSMPLTTFQPSDLLLLRILARHDAPL